MQYNRAQLGAINAKNVRFAKLISPYKLESYRKRAEVLEMDHAREATGSSPVSPSAINQAESYAWDTA